jgi:hypothetical protein
VFTNSVSYSRAFRRSAPCGNASGTCRSRSKVPPRSAFAKLARVRSASRRQSPWSTAPRSCARAKFVPSRSASNRTTLSRSQPDRSALASRAASRFGLTSGWLWRHWFPAGTPSVMMRYEESLMRVTEVRQRVYRGSTVESVSRRGCRTDGFSRQNGKRSLR